MLNQHKMSQIPILPILLVVLANLAGCSEMPVSINDVPNRSHFSEKQLLEDGLSFDRIELTSGHFPNHKRAIIDSDLDTTWNAVLHDIAGTEGIREKYFNRTKFPIDEYLKLINDKEFQEFTRDWGLLKFRMCNVSARSRNNKNKDTARISIDSAEYAAEDAIEGSTGRTFFEKNPLVYRNAKVVIHLHENDKRQTVVNILNYMSYGVRSGNASLAYPIHWEKFQAISKGNIEQAIIGNIVSAVARATNPITLDVRP